MKKYLIALILLSAVIAMPALAVQSSQSINSLNLKIQQLQKILDQQKKLDATMIANWPTYSGSEGVTFKYPNSLKPSCADLQQKPSVEITPSGSNKIDSLGCLPAPSGRSVKSEKVKINGLDFCLSVGNDAAVGNYYKIYNYTTLKDGVYYTLKYSAHTTTCGVFKNSLNVNSSDNAKYRACLACEKKYDSIVPSLIKKSVGTLTFVSASSAPLPGWAKFGDKLGFQMQYPADSNVMKMPVSKLCNYNVYSSCPTSMVIGGKTIYSRSATINGVSYCIFDSADIATSHSYYNSTYLTFNDSNCYQLDLAYKTINCSSLSASSEVTKCQSQETANQTSRETAISSVKFDPSYAVPEIKVASGPTSLSVGSTGTWLIKMNYPLKTVNSFSFFANWGDEPTPPEAPKYVGSNASSWDSYSTNFSHSYGKAGTYNPTFTVVNQHNQFAQTSLALTVGDPNNNNYNCRDLYWHDNSTTVCGQKQFCGAYMYSGLRTFDNLINCQNDLNGQRVCAQDMYTCPKTGVSVPRSGPNCQFVCS